MHDVGIANGDVPVDFSSSQNFRPFDFPTARSSRLVSALVILRIAMRRKFATAIGDYSLFWSKIEGGQV
jgi:hypothetical protein